ncbi:uncharacterized protein LOC130589462 [Beta vulgaris subsp. vulgaris]|uniref:uncharacterized protein LOC130589462 n=1 Tax=Beta vulgaris subsp. vulgaris TaxID=3555 RepID=UPI002546C4F1|nr:uncharacterized protein LOC130589462 [Beta vulgaris subsp. vulgaris]
MGDDARGRGKNKRMWTSIEESALVDILVDMQHSNWKCDTGYKTGYQSHIEKKMLERFPYCGLKGKPHIESKIKILKRQLGYILEAQKQASGFGWDDEMKMIIGEKEVFMGWAQGRDGASALYMKPFPLYEKLCEIYAKDRASGSMSKGPGDEEGDNNNEGDKQGDGSTSSTTQATEPSSYRGDRKRRREIENKELGGLSKALVSLIDVEKESTAVMNDLKKSFMRDVEIGEKRTKLFQALSGLEELSPMEIVEASTSIGLDDKKVELFFSMPDDFKVMFVKSQLKKQLGSMNGRRI